MHGRQRECEKVVISKTSVDSLLGDSDIRSVIEQLLDTRPLDGRRVLAIIPDHSRSGPTGTFFRLICEMLGRRAKQLDFLIALGTHAPMPDEKIAELLQIGTADRLAKFTKIGVYNHRWNDPSVLKQVGTLSCRKVEELSEGMLSLDVPVLLNKMVFDYDHLLICGPVFPHEVVGFSGGHKYLFPGIAAPQIINFTHWLGALITNPVINGTRNTPVRAAIEAAAEMVPVERSLIGYVVDGNDARGIFAGPVREAWHAATELSEKLQIVYCEKSYHTVLSCAPKMYDDIWTAGKCMYKLEPVVADGGTLIIYAPHIDEVSYSHGKVLDEIGYHTRDYFVRDWQRFQKYPWGVVAHSTHVCGIGTCTDGVDCPRIKVVLATRIPAERCRRIGLGYMDPATIDPKDYANREHEGVLLVPKAGEILYRLRDMSRFAAR